MQTLMSAWCGRRDSNPHNFRHWNLNPARLPIPPRPREKHPIRPRCRERRAYNMRPPVRSKKMAGFDSVRGKASQLDRTTQKWSASVRWQAPNSPAGPTRADGRAGRMPPSPRYGLRPAPPKGVPALALAGQACQSRAASPARPRRRSGHLQGPELRFKRGETVEIAFANELPVPAVLDWRGLDGVASGRAARRSARRSPPGRRKPCNCRCATPEPCCAASGCSATARHGRRRRGPWWSARASRSRSTATKCC